MHNSDMTYINASNEGIDLQIHRPTLKAYELTWLTVGYPRVKYVFISYKITILFKFSVTP